jgi:hypothetical protein
LQFSLSRLPVCEIKKAKSVINTCHSYSNENGRETSNYWKILRSSYQFSSCEGSGCDELDMLWTNVT